MKIIHYLNRDQTDRICLEYKDLEYIYIYDRNQKNLSLFTGVGIIEKYKELFDSGVNGCIECEISMYITRGISKNLGETVEFEIKIPEANKIVQEMNKKLSRDFPLF